MPSPASTARLFCHLGTGRPGVDRHHHRQRPPGGQGQHQRRRPGGDRGRTSRRPGVQVRHVAGKDNIKPSSEAVEMIDMDGLLPTVTLEDGRQVPVARSKLHGHRGVSRYNLALVEFVPLDPTLLPLPVSCATEAQPRVSKPPSGAAQSLLHPTTRASSLHRAARPRRVIAVNGRPLSSLPVDVEYMDRATW